MPTPPTSVPGLGTAEWSLNAGSVFMNHHSKLLGALFTSFAVLTLATASATHLKAEVRRVEELTKTEARRVEELTKTEAMLRLETEKTTAEAMLRQAAQSEAANQKSVADMFRVLTGAEHQDAVEMTTKKYVG